MLLSVAIYYLVSRKIDFLPIISPQFASKELVAEYFMQIMFERQMSLLRECLKQKTVFHVAFLTRRKEKQ
jgi:hypothetical protein